MGTLSGRAAGGPLGERAAIPNRPPAWYALNVKRNHERRVAEHLCVKSVTSFLPLTESPRSRRPRSGAALEPLFPGYLFVRLDDRGRSPGSWHTARWTSGVLRILGADGIPTPIPDEVVEAIQERVNECGYVRREAPFPPQARVRFHGGPLGGLEALFERPMSRSGRVRVLMTLLGRETAVEVDVLDLDCA